MILALNIRYLSSCILVMASEIQHEGSDIPSLRSQLMDEQRMRSDQGSTG